MTEKLKFFERMKYLNAVDPDSENSDFSYFRNDSKISYRYNVYFIKIDEIINNILEQQISNFWLWTTL